ncbi:T6SS phospholipase effector Tle1-like catalytic domain-containing protein [Marinobacter zhejiangensis]|uniref:Uncharacterized alpha/beta hydrolase domain n=1 Tax=Marinobacter zhejiangensis TaxID=488535 RepID=A0A1I4N713_9GAMM|nr:DUF2235 domain-containing protein [Marinobacter zhejiangensis]SFM11185.1 Uncharacterized alpha/beta hydrolase domain [Marinobacter zhejiangensis]
MKIVKTGDLVAADLPNLESPFFAAEKARALINSDQTGRFNLGHLLNHPSSYGTRRNDQPQRVDAVIEKIKNRALWLVYDVGDGKPFDPVVRWKEPAPGQGQWILTHSDTHFALSHTVNRLNDNGVTPQQLALSGAMGISPLSASTVAHEARPRQHEDALPHQAAPTRHHTSLPVTPALPLSASPEATQTPPQEQEPEIHLEVGLFTDGTLNNADNSQILEDRIEAECLAPLERGEISEEECKYRLGLMMGDSYANSPSNVAKLADLYIESNETSENRIVHRIMEYAPGIGTRSGEGDSVIGMVTGLGETGILMQLEKAFTKVAQRVLELTLTGPITTLTVDLFGFSRGAASARHAAHEIHQGSNGGLGRAFRAEGIDWPNKVTIRFVGLFDSVAAIINPKSLDLLPSNNQNAPVKVYLDPSTVQTAVHFVAADEHRENFALNSLRNPDGQLPDNFREIALPGVHSDIGGGYGDSQREDVLISPFHHVPNDRINAPEQSMQWDMLEALKQQKEAEGWLGEFSLPVQASDHPNPRPNDLGDVGHPRLEIYKQVSEHPGPHGRTELALRMVRQVRGEYSRVSLWTMHELASEAGVPFSDIDPEDEATHLPDELIVIKDQIREQICANSESPSLTATQLNLLRQRYIHYSAHYTPLKFMALGIPTTFRLFRNFSPNAPAESGERIVHPNR